MWQDDKAPTLLLQTVFVFDEWIKIFKWFTVLPRRLYHSRRSRGHPAFYRRRSHAAQSFPVCSFHQDVFLSDNLCWFLGSDYFCIFLSHLYDLYQRRNLPSVWKFICNVTLIPQNAKWVSSAMRSNICPIDPVHTRQTCCRNSIHLMEVVFSCVQMNGLLASNLPHVNTP